MAPKVSVVMCVYDGERYLSEALESILNQTFRDFEFIIIDDGSTDGTGAILGRYKNLDKRIQVYHQENQGFTASLNRGFRLAKGTYIARMDADDISLQRRFDKQVRFLDNHPEIGVVGTWVAYVEKGGGILGEWRTPISPTIAEWHLFFEPCVAHPSVMMRRDILKKIKGYNPRILQAQDYDLWVRIASKMRLTNLSEVLLLRRVHEDMVSVRHADQQENITSEVMQRAIKRYLNKKVSIRLVRDFRRMSTGLSLEAYDIQEVARFIDELYCAYIERQSPKKSERREIASDVADKLYSLVLGERGSLLARGRILFRAVSLKPRLLITSLRHVIKKIVKG